MKLRITVHGVAYEVDVEVLEASDEMQGIPTPIPASGAAAPPAGSPPPAVASVAPSAAAGGVVPLATDSGGVASPIAGTVLEVKCKVGNAVKRGDVLLVIEAMKMETAIAAPTSGTIKAVHAAAGDIVRENQILVEFTD